MYTTTLAVRANPSFPFPSYPLQSTYLVYGQFFRQSSLLYWSPSRRPPPAASRCRWSGAGDFDLGSKRRACCCHCQRSDEIRGGFNEEVFYGGWRDGLGSVCWSCRCEVMEMKRRNRGTRNGYGGGWRVKAGVRDYGEFSESSEDDGVCRCRESRKVYGRSNRVCDGRIREDDYVSEEEEDERRRTYYDDVERRKGSNLKNTITSRKKNRGVDKQVTRRDEWASGQKRERGSSSRDSAHETREEFRRRHGSTFYGKDSSDNRRNFTRVSDVHEDDIRKVYNSRKNVDDVRMQREKGTSNVHYLGGKKLSSQTNIKMKGTQEYFSEDEEDSRQWDSRKGTRKFVEISEVDKNDSLMISNMKNVTNRRKSNMQDSSSSSLTKHSEVDERIGVSKAGNSFETLKEISEINDSGSEEVWRRHKDYSVVNLNDRKDSLTSVQKLIDVKSQNDTTMELKGTSSNVIQGNQGGSRLVGEAELRFEGRQQYIHHDDVNLKQRASRDAHKRFVSIYEPNVDESMQISNSNSNADSGKMNIDLSSSSAFQQYTKVDSKASSTSFSKDVKTTNEKSEVYDVNTADAWHRHAQHKEATHKETSDRTNSVMIERHRREQDYQNLISSSSLNTELIDSIKTFKDHTSVSVVNASDTELARNAETYTGIRVKDQEKYLASTSNLVYEGKEHQNQRDQWSASHGDPVMDSGRYAQSSEFGRKDARSGSSTEVSSNVNDHRHISATRLGTDKFTSELASKDPQVSSITQLMSNTQINILVNNQNSSETEAEGYKQASEMAGRDSDTVYRNETTSSLRMKNKYEDDDERSPKESEQYMQVSKLTGSDAERVSSTHMISGMHLNDELEGHHYRSRRESEKYINSPELLRKNVMRVPSMQTTPSLPLDTEIQDYSLESELEKDRLSSSFSRADMKMVSNFQMVSTMKPESGTESSPSMSIQDKKEKETTLGGISQLEEITDYVSMEAYQIGSGSSNVHGQTKNEQRSSNAVVGIEVDMLGSARRFDRSSAFYTSEFVAKLQQEASTSKGRSEMQADEAKKENIQTSECAEPLVDGTQNESIQTTSVNLSQPDDTIKVESGNFVRERKRSSSFPSTTKGSSVKLRETSSLIFEEELHKEMREEDAATPTSAMSTSTAVTRRSPRSLWAFIADVIRLGWAPHAKSGALDQDEGMKTSPHHSTGSEAWFSGQEVDDSDEEIDNRGQIGASKGSLLSTQSSDQTWESRYSSLEQRVSETLDLVEGAVQSEISPSTLVTVEGSVSTDVPVSRLQGSIYTGAITGKTEVPTTLTTVGKPSIAGNTASDIIDTSRSGMKFPSVPLIGFTMSEEEFTEDPTTVQEFTGQDGKLKRGMFQRNNQVVKEAFDEWKEAYRLESEQRKVDEIFMKEAPQKAGDMWEVPVGAVLVQNGKIIARACNLVEDTRDSTAHAEMICIREASNLLRTWRLAGMTLYVTLEPCPMCAGAILQARVDTVVWGAPNKLLGADGSWVRLFPTGDGGSTSLDSSNQQAGPIHPFHPKIIVRRGILATKCSDVMQQFFRLRRKKEKKLESSAKH